MKKGYQSSDHNNSKRALVSNRFLNSLQKTVSDKTLTRDISYVWALPIDMSNLQTNAEMNTFVEYLSYFNELDKYVYNNIPVSDLFFYYNLIVNKNRYGQTSLTKMFDSYVTDKPSSVMSSYFKFIGDLDYEKLLSDSDFEQEDLIRACAIPIGSSYNKKYPYVKKFDPSTGTYKVFKYLGGLSSKESSEFEDEYDDVSMLDIDTEDNDDWNDEEETTTYELKAPSGYVEYLPPASNVKDYYNYFINQTPSYNRENQDRSGRGIARAVSVSNFSEVKGNSSLQQVFNELSNSGRQYSPLRDRFMRLLLDVNAYSNLSEMNVVRSRGPVTLNGVRVPSVNIHPDGDLIVLDTNDPYRMFTTVLEYHLNKTVTKPESIKMFGDELTRILDSLKGNKKLDKGEE